MQKRACPIPLWLVYSHLSISGFTSFDFVRQTLFSRDETGSMGNVPADMTERGPVPRLVLVNLSRRTWFPDSLLCRFASEFAGYGGAQD